MLQMTLIMTAFGLAMMAMVVVAMEGLAEMARRRSKRHRLSP